MNCLIVDDEPLVRTGMRRLIRQYSQLRLLGPFKNAANIADFLEKNEVYLLFLDMEMPGVNGLEFARTLPKQALVIFTATYSQYVLDNYEAGALNYLVRPITPERFRKVVVEVESYHQLLTQRETDFESIDTRYTSTRTSKRNYRIAHNDILYIEVLEGYTVIHTFTNEYIMWINLKNIHSQLPSALFICVNKNYVVNVQHISSYAHQSVYIGKTEIPIGGACKITSKFGDQQKDYH